MQQKAAFILLLALLNLFSLAQSPPLAISYQTIVRDNAGDIIANSAVSLRFDIHQATISGTVVYSESHTLNTNEFGLANLEIGQGSPLIGTFASIDWSAGPYFNETWLDPAGGSSYTSMGTDQMLSVPYALFAESAGNTDDADANPANELNSAA